MDKNLKQTSFLFGSNAVFIEELYQLYLSDHKAVDESWQDYFQNIENNNSYQVNKTIAHVITSPQEKSLPYVTELSAATIVNSGGLGSRSDGATPICNRRAIEDDATDFSSIDYNKLRAKAMIASYRNYGHYLVKLDPLNLEVLKTKNELRLNIEDFGFTIDQLNNIIEIDDEFFGIKACSLKELVNLLDQTYIKDIAVEFAHVTNEDEKTWFFEQIESNAQDLILNFLHKSKIAPEFLEETNPATFVYSDDCYGARRVSSEQESPTRLTYAGSLLEQDKKNILQDLVEIEGFEQYLHTKFPGAKRFSIEGGETAVVAIDKAINMSIIHGLEDVVIGMAHRGRLSTLAKVMNKPYKAILSGFITGSILPTDLGISGDVKYHIGYSSDQIREGSKVHLSMADNPSHLEAVNPVVAGKVRAKQDSIQDTNRKKVMGILVHGDSAFCGQGVVAESLFMSDLKPYKVGGIIHFVINNQLGFTANSYDTRPGRYSTEFAKIINSPILHVNGDDIEAVIKATNIAVNYRYKFARDIVVEIICYRKYGHNEGDEPMYTQGVMYNVIKNKQSPATIFANKLVAGGIIDQNYFPTLKEQFKLKLDQEYEQAKNYQPQAQFLEGLWSSYTRSNAQMLSTGVNKNTLKELGIKLCQIPKDFPLNPKLVKLFELRENTLKQDKPIDWATAEQLAFASLLNTGTKIRFTGQDCGRGTFSHRHAVLHSQVDDRTYTPLNNLSQSQANFEIADSNLSEYAVLGFEYGYSLVNPKDLVIWEAQFGDFANGTQIIFDQFISSSESKWLRMSGIVVLLPHGLEGQGPEHSSARLERFLQLAAENNIQVTYPTTPASFFHLLRRQIYSNIRKPLIVMSPKSLLRHKMVVSPLSQLDENTSFIPVLDEINDAINAKEVKRIILCSGKVYYDLLEKREEKSILDIVIIRLEQLYPFETDFIIKILGKYNKVKEFIWCQEEPKNMGAWNFVKDHLNESLKNASINNQFVYVGRNESASPAVGSPIIHNEQQKKLLEEALIINLNSM
ncbi:2-oxoglutarate dehydrogenase E1 component [Candidatus Tisiphia endosymbiont of Ditula angustiorana]|uniref:2-oxoglutarate dehydrogenase E1 component n=1 Tax=Candidatus Tisiphia endosymbiont of Ditula angustiorana TaxID=3066272 RepID=UPI00312CA971